MFPPRVFFFFLNHLDATYSNISTRRAIGHIPRGDADSIRATLAQQLTSPVQWEKSMQTLLEKGMTSSTEVGPGKVISGIMKRIDKTAVCENFTV